jgi:plastocyanin
MKKSLLGIIAIVALIIIALYVFWPTSQQTDSTQKTPNQITINPSAQNPNDNSDQTAKTVSIKGFAFTPNILTIKQGETITWTNEDGTSHTVTSDTGKELDSGIISNGKSYSHTFAQKGTYTYHCALHGAMKGTIIVE